VRVAWLKADKELWVITINGLCKRETSEKNSKEQGRKESKEWSEEVKFGGEGARMQRERGSRRFSAGGAWQSNSDRCRASAGPRTVPRR
jgi:hypothetical protein